MMLLTRSIAIVELVCSTGTRPPSGSRSSDAPGWQSMKYSPISDCGRISQRASLRRSASPGSVTSASTSASGPAVDLRDLEGLRLPGAHAGDLEVAALGEPERVVEEQIS